MRTLAKSMARTWTGILSFPTVPPVQGLHTEKHPDHLQKRYHQVLVAILELPGPGIRDRCLFRARLLLLLWIRFPQTSCPGGGGVGRGSWHCLPQV